MTGRIKSGTTRIEVDIEKNREESNWSKVIELAEQLKEKSPEFGCLSDFLIGEGKLESYLEEYPPIEVNINKAKIALIDAKRYLNYVISEDGKKADVAMDAHLLLGKLQYACGQYAEGLQHYKLAELQNLTEKKLPLRSMRIVAESYAIKGLCLQKNDPAVSKFKKAERLEEVTKCFELSSDLSILYMQKLEKDLNFSAPNTSTTGSHSPAPPLIQKSLSPVLEQALQIAPILLLQEGKINTAIERYRNTLSAIESQGTLNIRLKFMCQMAELLLQRLAGEKYIPPLHTTPKSSLWKPKYYTSLNQFIPRNECEEIVLLLQVAESMAVRNAVLSQSPEFKDVRLSAYQEAIQIYDLLTVATVRWGQLSLLQECLERPMKFSFEEIHLWKQYALNLMSLGQFEQALSVMKDVIRLDKYNVSNYLLAAKLCYEHLNLPKDGIQFCNEAKEQALKTSSRLLGRVHLFIGIGFYLQADICNLRKDKENLWSNALDNFKTAVELEPHDYLCRHYLGLQLAMCDQIAEAQQHVRLGLNLNPEHSSSLHLLVLLLTAERQYNSALIVVENALEEYPDCLNLLYVKARLELHEKGGEVALITAKQMLELWKTLYESQTISDMPECDRKSDTRSVFQLYTSEMSDKDSSSLQLHNTAVTRIEQALSEVASSMSSFNPKPGPQRTWMLQVEVWLLLAEIYLNLDQTTDVQMCIKEATQIYPLSHHVMHMKGLLHMYKEEWLDAKLCFQNAIAINPQHVKSLQQLGLVYHYLGYQGLAETTLREAAKTEPKNHVTWYNLGKVLEALGEYEKASNAMATALMEEKTNPILPFNSVPLSFG